MREFDLISALQLNAKTPLHEAMIVPTILGWLRSGRIRVEASFAR